MARFVVVSLACLLFSVVVLWNASPTEAQVATLPLDNRAHEGNGHMVVSRVHRRVIFGHATHLGIRWLRRFGREVRSYDQHECQGDKTCHKPLPSRLCAVYCCAS